MSNKRQFRCSSCGEYFTLSDEENEVYEEGYYAIDPNTCDDCYRYDIMCGGEDTDYSDADSGL